VDAWFNSKSISFFSIIALFLTRLVNLFQHRYDLSILHIGETFIERGDGKRVAAVDMEAYDGINLATHQTVGIVMGNRNCA
jgi:hypothetical protein